MFNVILAKRFFAACIGLVLTSLLATAGVADAADASHLIAMEDVDLSDHKSSTLPDGVFELHFCREHFPRGTSARHELLAAVDLFNNVDGAEVQIDVVETDHHGVGTLYSDDPNRSYIDYVYEEFPCHSRSGGDWDSSFYANTCRYQRYGGWGGWGRTNHFTIGVDGWRFGSTTNYPQAQLIAHELGHAFGMDHTSDWPEADKAIISTMAGQLEELSAHDIAFLRQYYPGSDANFVNLVPSAMIRRYDPANDRWQKFGFNSDYADAYTGTKDGNEVLQRGNPRELYKDGAGNFRDCAENGTEHPRFMAQWFNKGTGNTNSDFTNRLAIGEPDWAASDDYAVVRWRAAGMPGEAQDRYSNRIALNESDLITRGPLAYNNTYQLKFKVNALSAESGTPCVNERYANNNEITTPIILRWNRDACQDL